MREYTRREVEVDACGLELASQKQQGAAEDICAKKQQHVAVSGDRIILLLIEFPKTRPAAAGGQRAAGM
jgi:hypothetical protein